MSAVLYVTAPSEKEARKMAEELIKKKLVACANIFPISSLYRWKEELKEEKEVAMILKTSTERVEEVIRELKRIHPYELPCILCLSVSGGLPEFFRWVEEETRPN
jgi:periplasmic divalent cation tolerance protein